MLALQVVAAVLLASLVPQAVIGLRRAHVLVSWCWWWRCADGPCHGEKVAGPMSLGMDSPTTWWWWWTHSRFGWACDMAAMPAARVGLQGRRELGAVMDVVQSTRESVRVEWGGWREWSG